MVTQLNLPIYLYYSITKNVIIITDDIKILFDVC